jgi:hypothetical protein
MQMFTMSTPAHASASPDADGLGVGVGVGLGVGEGVGAGVVGRGDGELDLDTGGDAVGAGLAEPCDCGAAMPLGEVSGLLLTGAESAVRCRAALLAVTW